MQSKYNIKEVIVIKFCENCGYQLEDNAHFCEECGCVVEQDEPNTPIKPNEPAETVITDQNAEKGVNNGFQNIENGANNVNVDVNSSLAVPAATQNTVQNDVADNKVNKKISKKPKKIKNNINKANGSVIDNQELNKRKQIKIIAVIVSLVIILLGVTATVTSYVVDNKNNDFGRFSNQWGVVNIETATEPITEITTEEITEETAVQEQLSEENNIEE